MLMPNFFLHASLFVFLSGVETATFAFPTQLLNHPLMFGRSNCWAAGPHGGATLKSLLVTLRASLNRLRHRTAAQYG